MKIVRIWPEEVMIVGIKLFFRGPYIEVEDKIVSRARPILLDEVM